MTHNAGVVVVVGPLVSCHASASMTLWRMHGLEGAVVAQWHCADKQSRCCEVFCSVRCTRVGVWMTGERGQGRWALVGVELDQDSCRQEQATATVQWGWLATALCLCVFVCKKMHCIAFFIGFLDMLCISQDTNSVTNEKPILFYTCALVFNFKHSVYCFHIMHFTSPAFVFGIVLS